MPETTLAITPIDQAAEFERLTSLIEFAQSSKFESERSGMLEYLKPTLLWLYLIASILCSVVPLFSRTGSIWMMLLVVYGLGWIRRKLQRRVVAVDALNKHLHAHPKADMTRRIICIGKAPEIASVIDRGKIEDVAHEPSVFLLPGVVPIEQWQSLLWTIVTAGAAYGLWMFLRVTGLSLFPHLVIWPSICFGGVIVCYTRPTRLRIVPGKLQVLRYGWLGQTVVKHTSYNIRGWQVVVDMDRSVIFAGNPKKPAQLSFAAADRPEEVVHAVLMAAVSTYTPPELPKDQLI